MIVAKKVNKEKTDKPTYIIPGETLIPPFIIPNLNGKCYLMPSWIEIPLGTKLEDINVVWKKFTVNIKELGYFKSTRGRKSFKVTKNLRNGDYVCKCSQYSFRKKTCPHIERAKDLGH